MSTKLIGSRGAVCAAVLLIASVGWSPARGNDFEQAVTPEVQARLRDMPLEHFPAVYVSGSLSEPESESLTRRFKNSVFPGYVGLRPDGSYEQGQADREVWDSYGGLAEMRGYIWYPVPSHPYLAGRLPGLKLYAFSSVGAYPELVGELDGKFYFLPGELPTLLCDRGEKLGPDDVLASARVTTLLQLSAVAVKRSLTDPRNVVILPRAGGAETITSLRNSTRAREILAGREPLFPEMWLSEPVACSLMIPIVRGSPDPGVPDSVVGYDTELCAGLRFRVEGDTGLVEVRYWGYRIPQRSVCVPHDVYIWPGPGSRLRWPRGPARYLRPRAFAMTRQQR